MLGMLHSPAVPCSPTPDDLVEVALLPQACTQRRAWGTSPYMAAATTAMSTRAGCPPPSGMSCWQGTRWTAAQVRGVCTVRVHRVCAPCVCTVRVHRVCAPCVFTECVHRVCAPCVFTECVHRMCAPCVFTVCVHCVCSPCVFTVCVHQRVPHVAPKD